MIEQLRRALTNQPACEQGAFRECRRCGTTVDADASGCPACGSTEIALYEL
jgi:rubrerythrin